MQALPCLPWYHTALGVGAGSFTTGGTLFATGTITGGAINTGGAVSAAGTVTGSQFNGSGAGLTNISAGAVVGTVGSATNATNATNAFNVTGASQPTITSLGTLSSLNISGALDVNGIPNFNQGLYMVIPTRTGDPSTSTDGSFYLRLTSFGGVSGLRAYAGGSWNNV